MATPAASSRPAVTGHARSLQPGDAAGDAIRDLTAIAARATVGRSTQLSWATTPEKRIWPGQRASEAPATRRTHKGSTPRQIRKGKTGRSPHANAVARRATLAGSALGKIRNKPERTRGSPGLRRSEEHTSELQSRGHLVCRLLLE